MVHTVIQHLNCVSSYTTVDSIKHEWIVGWLVLWSLTSLSTIFQVYRGCHFHWWRKLEYQEKTTDLPQVTDKLYQIMLYPSPWFDLTSVVIGTDCIGTGTEINGRPLAMATETSAGRLNNTSKEPSWRTNNFIFPCCKFDVWSELFTIRPREIS